MKNSFSDRFHCIGLYPDAVDDYLLTAYTAELVKLFSIVPTYMAGRSYNHSASPPSEWN